MTAAYVINAIHQMTGISEGDLASILEKFESKTIKKNTSLLSDGDTAREIYLILSGCIRLFYIKDGADISAYFFTEGMFAGAYDSFVSQQPSRHSIETVEECKLLVINYKEFQKLYVTFPVMNELVRKVIEERFVSLHQLFTSQILDSPEERYLNLQKHRPDLLQRIPQHQIATFLGVTPESLSRIRNRVAKK